MAIYDAPESLHVGNGVETVFGFNWPYLLPRDLIVTVNGQPVPTVLASPNQVAVTPAPAALSIVRIYRNTPAQNPTYLFATGIPMLPKYIDGNNKQLLYALQEGLLTFGSVEANANATVQRSLRVGPDEPPIPLLPSKAMRAGRILGFDSEGNPVGHLPASGSATELALQLAESTDAAPGAAMVGWRGQTVAHALSWQVSPSQFHRPGDTDDTASFRRMHAALNAVSGIRPLVQLAGAYTVTGGFDPTQYEWAGCTWISAGATINANALTGDNGVLQVGSDFNLQGHLNINITGTAAGGNGFVRTAVTAGRWWAPQTRITNFHLGSLRITTSTGVVGLAISGSAKYGSIERVEVGGSFAIGVLVHWSGFPNDILPVATYHPNNIRIGHVHGTGATESLLVYSAAFAVTTQRLTGTGNAKNLLCIAGDWGARYAQPDEVMQVGEGLSVEEFGCAETGIIGAHIVGQPGLVGGYTLDMPVRLGTGVLVGGSASTQGILHSNVRGGFVGDVTLRGFTNGAQPGAFVYGVRFQGTKFVANRANGFRISAASDPRRDIVLDHVVARDNNTLAAGGVAQIEIGSSAENVHLINPVLVSTNLAGSGIHLTGTARNCLIESPRGEGFGATRYVVQNDASPDNNNIIRDIRSDSPTNKLTPSSNPVLMRINGIGRRVFATDGIPTVGTYAQGDICEFNTPSTQGHRGATCSVPGTPGTWIRYGAVIP